MRVIPSQDERDLAAMCRKLLATELEPDAQWKALTAAGVLGLPIDGSLTDVGMFCLEAGRALCPRVVQSTLYAALTIQSLGVGSDWLHRLTSGEARGTYALFDSRDASVGLKLSGVADFVPNADVADVIIASTASGVVAVETAAAGISVEPVAMMGGYPVFTVRFDDVLVDASAVDEEQLRRVANAIVALDCLDLVGVGEAVVQRTVDYTTMREQFGRPIASLKCSRSAWSIASRVAHAVWSAFLSACRAEPSGGQSGSA